MTRHETAAILALFRPIWPNHPIENVEETVAVWHAALSRVVFEDAQEAALVCVRECKFHPTPADVIERARPIRSAREQLERQLARQLEDEQLVPISELLALDPPADPAARALLEHLGRATTRDDGEDDVRRLDAA